jgi:hypothetical protein
MRHKGRSTCLIAAKRFSFTDCTIGKHNTTFSVRQVTHGQDVALQQLINEDGFVANFGQAVLSERLRRLGGSTSRGSRLR